MIKSGPLIVFGEVLFDQFPDGSEVLGGAPFNVAWHLQALGQSPRFISRVGDDPQARRIRDAMTAHGMNRAGLQKDSGHATGAVQVQFDDGEPSYEICHPAAWDAIDAMSLPPMDPGGLLYHGSLALRSEASRSTLEALRQQPDRACFMDVNLRDPWWQRDQVLADMCAAHWVKLNHHELRLMGFEDTELMQAAGNCLQQCKLQGLLVTSGEAGALAITADGRHHSVTPQPATRVVDTVGAGDAFTSVFLAGLLEERPLDQAMEAAQQLASAVVGIRGALPDTSDFYQPFR